MRTARVWLAPWTALVLAFQAFHVTEHAVQAYQKYALGIHHAQGLLGALVHSEFLHFLPNALFAAALVPVAMAGGAGPSWRLFQLGLVASGYHVVEHSVKLVQSLALGHEVTLGILGHWFDLIPLHLALNAIVFALVAPHLALHARSLPAWTRGRPAALLPGPL